MTFNVTDFSHRSEASLRHAFNEAEKRGWRFMAVVENTHDHQDPVFSSALIVALTTDLKLSLFKQAMMMVASEDALMRQLRYEGLRPEGKPLKLVRIFHLAGDFDAQIATPAEQTLTAHLSADTQQAYARYLTELERKYAPARPKTHFWPLR